MISQSLSTKAQARTAARSEQITQLIARGSVGQKGIALFISLVLLLVLTIIGVSSVQSTSLEERMARNAHDSVLAFQSAEMGLRQAEEWMLANTPLSTDFSDTGASGLWTAAPFGVPPRWQSDAVWDGGAVVEVPLALDNVESQPRYMIEFLATVDLTSDPFVVGEGYPVLTDTINIFRVTARGVGGSDTAEVLLQSSFGLISEE